MKKVVKCEKCGKSHNFGRCSKCKRKVYYLDPTEREQCCENCDAVLHREGKYLCDGKRGFKKCCAMVPVPAFGGYYSETIWGHAKAFLLVGAVLIVLLSTFCVGGWVIHNHGMQTFKKHALRSMKFEASHEFSNATDTALEKARPCLSEEQFRKFKKRSADLSMIFWVRLGKNPSNLVKDIEDAIDETSCLAKIDGPDVSGVTWPFRMLSSDLEDLDKDFQSLEEAQDFKSIEAILKSYYVDHLASVRGKIQRLKELEM